MSKERKSQEEEPKVYAVRRETERWQLNRRDFLALSSAAMAALAAGCSPRKPEPTFSPTPEPAPSETPTPTGVPTLSPAEWEEACFAVAAHNDGITAMVINPVHSLLITASWDGSIKLWSLKDRQLIKVLNEGTVSQTMVVSQDGSVLAAALFNKIGIWSLPGGDLLSTLEGHRLQIACMQFSPDGTRLVSTERDKNIRVWSIPDGKPLNTIQTEEKVQNLSFSPDGSLLISSQAGDLYLRSFPDGGLVRTVESNQDSIHDILMHPNGNRVVTTEINGEIVIWSFPKFEEVQVIEIGTAIAISKDGALLVVKAEPQIKFWSFEQGQFIDAFNLSNESLAVHPDGSLIALGSAIGKISLWSYPEKQLLGCPMDLDVTNIKTGGVVYEITNTAGEITKYTYPCGSDIPDGAVCTCNCVIGKSTNNHSPHYWYPN
jgi:WD40 repeat protein